MKGGRAAVGESRAGRIALYSGSFLGPFAGGLTNSILPEIGESFSRSADSASASITAYMIPFIGALLISAPLGARWGVRRTVAAAYLLFMVASLLAALAPVWWLFQVARGLQGLANAFTTPLLLVVVGSITPKNRLGAALGLVAAMQAAGNTVAPLLAGVMARFDWRWAFGAVAAAGLLFFCVPIPQPSTSGRAAPRLRDAWTAPAIRLAATFFLVGLTFVGLSFLLALYVGEKFGFSPTQRGLLLACGGAAGILSSRFVGSLVDRFGSGRSAAASLALGAGAIALIPIAPAVGILIALWSLTGLANSASIVAINSAILRLPNATGALSIGQAARFLGVALAPVVLLPLFRFDHSWGFWAPAIAVAGVAVLFAAGSVRGTQRLERPIA